MQIKITCVHCGPTPVDHGVEKMGVYLDHLFGPLHRFGAFWLRLSAKILRGEITSRFVFYLLKTFSFFGVGELVSELHSTMNYRTRVLWEAAEARGIVMHGFMFLGRPSDVLFARYGNAFMVFDALPRKRGKRSKAIEWMDNKGKMRMHFQKAGLPVSNGAMLRTVGQGKRLFSKLDAPVILKPSEGSRSRHTTINVINEKDLLSAIKVAKQLSPWYILEEQLEGFVYRATVIGGDVVGVIRRMPPGVYGDGVHTIRDLVTLENKNPLRHGPIFHELETGADADMELARQGLSWESVARQGVFVSLHPKVGRSSGAGNIDVTDETHSENILLFKKVAEVLEESLVGIDFIIPDISKSWREQKKTGVIEVNSLPFIDLHHYPLEGLPRDAAGRLWDVVFPGSSEVGRKPENSSKNE